MRLFVRFINLVGWVLVTVAGFSGIALLLLIVTSLHGIPRTPEELNRLIAVPPTEVYAADGSLLTRVGGRTVVPLDRISEPFRLSVLAAEDDDFFNHKGIDKPALLKAIAGAMLGSYKRGGSTITQQLTRNLFFTFKKTYSRKFKEILATLEIERRFSKEEILESYCNGIYFGSYAYGVEEAAMGYFGTHASNLSLAQSALLAGLPQSPSRYNPYRQPGRAIARQHWILGRLKRLGLISDLEYEEAMAEQLEFKPLYASADEGSYFLDAVLNFLEEEYGSTVLYHGGLKIYTTLDPVLQGYAIEAVRSTMADLDKDFGLDPIDGVPAVQRENYPQAAFVAMEAPTGAVVALVGGRDWEASQFNRATQNVRNMGSALKPVLYLTAIEQFGLTPATVIVDGAIDVILPGVKEPWKPENFETYYQGPVVLKRALEHSLNSVAVRTILMIGPEAMAETLRRMGVRSEIVPHYSIALGGVAISPVELAAVGAVFANLGEVVEPYFVRRVEDAHGRVLQEHLVTSRKEFNPETIYLIVDMMMGVVEEGNARIVKNLGVDVPVIGKTGTTNDYRDSWFFGATPRFSACAWVGFDDNHPMILPDEEETGITGTHGATPIWARFMVRAIEGEPPRDFPVPPGIEYRWINYQTGEPMDSSGWWSIRVAMGKEMEAAEFPSDSMLFEIIQKGNVAVEEVDTLEAR